MKCGCAFRFVWFGVALGIALSMLAQSSANERAFSQSKAAIEKALKQLQASTSGHLPTLDGFAVPGDQPLERFQRGFYQCTVQVSEAPSGASVVRVSAKITAWYDAPTSAQSGYRVLTSNGRLESDLLDRLSDALGHNARLSSAPPAQPAPARTPNPPDTAAASAPDAPSSSISSQAFHGSSSPEAETPSTATQKAVTDRRLESLRADAKNLEEILRNQSHPRNLVAVKKSGTPVLANANQGGKVLFLASAEDEFELLDENTNWVHVRISGLSRGWIDRSKVEASGVSVAPTAQLPAQAPPEKPANGPRFQIEHEEIAAFPANWQPLQGKVVKIVSVQPATAVGGDAQAKLDFTKSLFNKEYAELANGKTMAAGVVVVFDSEDGGMLAATLPVLQQWKAGTLSDEAMWRRCYVDPPDMVKGAATP